MQDSIPPRGGGLDSERCVYITEACEADLRNQGIEDGNERQPIRYPNELVYLQGYITGLTEVTKTINEGCIDFISFIDKAFKAEGMENGYKYRFIQHPDEPAYLEGYIEGLSQATEKLIVQPFLELY